MASRSRSRSSAVWGRRARRAALLGGIVGLGAVAGASRHPVRRTVDDDHDPYDRTLPDGRSLAVTSADGTELAVTVAGPDDAPTVVLAHCWMGGRIIWAAVARELARAGHRVVLYDQRGHGESAVPAEAPTIEHLADDLRAVLEAVEATDAVLVGHSMGGMTIQSYAKEHPEDFRARARGVVLVSTSARPVARPLHPTLVERALGEGRQDWTRRGRAGRVMARGALGEHARRSHVEVTRHCLTTTHGHARAGFALAMGTMDLRATLPTMDVPATVVVGSRDRLTPPAMAAVLAEGLPDAELVTLPGRGHMLPLEAPEAILDAVHATSKRAASRR